MTTTPEPDAPVAGGAPADDLAPSRASRWRHTALLVASAGVVLAATFSARSVVIRPDGLPAWDAAQYLVEASRYRDSLLHGDVLAFLKQLTKPELHPPVHKLALGLALLVFGNTITVARAFPTALWFASLAVLVAMGKRLRPRDGVAVGAVAAAFSALGVEELRYVATPMTEPTALLVTLGVLLGAMNLVPREDARSQLKVGGLVLLAGLVRYNLPPMLLAALYGSHILGNLRDRPRLLDRRVLLWLAPTVGFFLAWQLVRPELVERIRTFLTNRSSGLEFWSAQNLLWVPRTLADSYAGSRPLAGLLGVAWVAAAWRDRRDAGRRLLHVYVAVTFALLTYHDYKIDRSLTIAWPLTWFLALGAVADLAPALLDRAAALWRRLYPVDDPSDAPGNGLRAALPWAPLAAVVVAGLVFLPWLHATRIRTFAEKDDFRPEPVVREVLERLEQEGRGTEQLWVTGWFFRLSPNLIEWWLRSHDVPAKLKLDQVPLREKTRTGIDLAWDEKYAAWVAERMLPADVRAKTTFVTLETTPGAHFWDAWTAYGNNYARAMAEQTAVPEVDRLSFVDEGLLVRVYREGGTAYVDTSDAGVDHDAGVQLPAVTPLFRDTFGKRAAAWMLVPAKALSAVSISREGSSLKITVPTPQATLQLCGPVPAYPGPFRVVLNARTEGLKGRAWLHARGMDDAGALQYVGAAPDIVQLGPLAAEADKVYERDVTLGPTSAHVKLCLVMDGATGTVELEDVAFVAPDAPRLTKQQLADVAAPAAEKAPAVPPVPGTVPPGEADLREASVEGDVLFREAFNHPDHGWRAEGEDAGRVALVAGDTSLALVVDGPPAHARVCGPAVTGAAGAELVLHANARLEGPARLQLRGLTYTGRVLKTKAGDAVRELDLPGNDGRLQAAVDLPAGVAQVRPCVVLDGARGRVELRDVAFVARVVDGR